MKTWIVFLSLFGFSAPSLAIVDFNGHWVAKTGTMTMSNGRKTECSNIEIIMKQEEGKLTTQKYKARCGLMDSDWGPDPMTIKGETVYNLYDEEIGTLKGDTLLTSEAISGVVYAFNLKLHEVNGKKILQSYYGTKNILGVIVIEGNLELAP